MKALSFRRNFSWSLLGTVVFSATNWFTTIVLVKLGSPEILGKYALGIAITQPVFSFAQLQLRSVQATDAKSDFSFKQFFTLRLLCACAAMIFILAVSFPGNPVETAWVVFLTGVGLAVDSVCDIIHGLLQRHQRLDYVGKSMAMKGCLNIILIGSSYYLTHNIIIAMIGSVAASTIMLVLYDRRNALLILRATAPDRSDRPTDSAGIEWKVLGRLAWLALPLGVALLLMSLCSNVSRYFIDHYCGERQLGIYSALGSLTVIGRTVVNALAQAITPRLAASFKHGELNGFRHDMRRFGLVCFAIGAVVPVAALLLGPGVIAKLFTKDYSHDFVALIVLLLAGLAGNLVSCVGYALTAVGVYRSQVPWFGITAVFAFVFSWLLVPSYGLLGAAFAALFIQVVQLVIGCVILRIAMSAEQEKTLVSAE